MKRLTPGPISDMECDDVSNGLSAGSILILAISRWAAIQWIQMPNIIIFIEPYMKNCCQLSITVNSRKRTTEEHLEKEILRRCGKPDSKYSWRMMEEAAQNCEEWSVAYVPPGVTRPKLRKSWRANNKLTSDIDKRMVFNKAICTAVLWRIENRHNN